MQTTNKINKNIIYDNVGSNYVKLSSLLLVITIISLIPNFLPALITDSEALSIGMTLHGILFLAWYLLFATQSLLVNKRKLKLHKTLGSLSIVFTLVLVASGTLMLLQVMTFQPVGEEKKHLDQSPFIWAIIHTLISFISFYSLAIIFRKSPPAHRRLMMLSSLSMMPATITRFAYLPIIPIDGTAFTLLTSYALFSTPILIDLFKSKKVHLTLVYGTSTYIVTQVIFMAFIPTTTLGKNLAYPF